MTRKELEQTRKNYLQKYLVYQLTQWDKFNYEILNNVMYTRRSGRGRNDTWSDVIMMADTETSKKCIEREGENHVCAWSMSIRAFDMNLVTLFGHDPDEFVECLSRVRDHIQGDRLILFFHNLPYDWTFLRKFIFEKFGQPVKQLNIKSHYPLFINLSNGIQIRDSLILAQRSLEKWAKDMKVEHLKAVGSWDYEKIRSQKDVFTTSELEYIEHDTLAGVECIQATLKALNKKIWSLPYTATGIPREEVRKRGLKNGAKDLFERISIEYETYKKLEKVFHGGFTHANRHIIGQFIGLEEKTTVSCFDFASSYPFVLLSERYPLEKFTPFPDRHICDILRSSENNAFIFKLILFKPRLKNDFIPMPARQFSKCVKSINPMLDNGRILSADYVEIYLNEIDLEVINNQYEWEGDLCCEIETARKKYLPRWFTDYIFELFENKCTLKHGDPVLYALAKAKLNSLYGLCVQKSIKQQIDEDYATGEYLINTDLDEKTLYDKYLKNKGNILLFSWGCYCTSYAFRNLFTLGSCVDDQGEKVSHWLYSDTDSCYSDSWDLRKVEEYNKKCKEKLLKNNYGPVTINEKEFWLGIAEHKEGEDDYNEFVTVGAKRYCGRNIEDGILHLTVAGVPKKPGALCLENDITNFREGFIFSGTKTGKLTHKYYYTDHIYEDDNGNITGDSIDLTPCDYLLSSVEVLEDWWQMFDEDIPVQIYDEGRL